MIKFMRSAVVVVACVAGFGAWGAKVAVAPNPTYASELFGADSVTIKYPDKMTPKVTVTIPANRTFAAVTTGDDQCAARDENHDGSVEITFTVLGGTFASNVTGLMYDRDGAPRNGGAGGDAAVVCGADASNDLGCEDEVAAPAAVASIVSGGRVDNHSVTIKIEEAGRAADGTATDGTDAARPSAVVASQPCNTAAAALTALSADGTGAQTHTISFDMPTLKGLSDALKDAAKAKTMMKAVSLRAESRIISGAFTDGFLTGNQDNSYTETVLKSRDAVTVSITDPNTKNIVIKGDSAFKAVKEAVKDYVELATVTVNTRTKHVTKAATKATKDVPKYRLDSTVTANALSKEATDGIIYEAAKAAGAEMADVLYGLDGKAIDAGLRGTLTVNAMGTRDLFNDGDMLFVDYDGNKMMGGSEGIDIDGDMGMGTALSIDPDTSESFKGGVGTFKVYYKAGGKESINHGAMINLTAMVDYSNPSATDEAPMKTSTTLNFEGVGSPVMAYAIPHSTNGTGDMANVRARCESSAGCRVFLECWDDMGMRGFGEAGMIEGNALVKWDAAAIEGVIGVSEPMSRHSCRILSVGKVTVQQLTRDGNSGTLVNNTYVGGGM